MNLRLYNTTGGAISVFTRMLGLELRITGLERLPNRPILFVVNHFTRFETFLVPYVIHQRFRRPVRTLAMDGLFKGWFGRYLQRVGVISTRDPHRNRTIISDLMTGRNDWVIYPEGGLVKSKRTLSRGKFTLDRPGGKSRPHTGAAILALKAELFRRRYAETCRDDDPQSRAYYESQYSVNDARDIAERGPVLIPVNITYPRLRAVKNICHRAAALMRAKLDPVLDEELQIEGSILFRQSEVSLHFGAPIAVDEYLDAPREIARRLIGRFRPEQKDVLLRRQAMRLTNRAMREIYHTTEIHFEHLFCYALRVLRRASIPVPEFRERLCLAAMTMRQDRTIRLHPELQNGILALTRDQPFSALEEVEALAVREGILRRKADVYFINRAAIEQEYDYTQIRLRSIAAVMANELEAIDHAAKIMREVVNRRESEIRERLPLNIFESDRRRFRREYDRWHRSGLSRAAKIGEPFLLEADQPRAGVVLVHGYLSCPEQMRPMAEALRARGCTVYGVRLEGHGTSPENLTDCSWRHWRDAVDEAHTTLRMICPKVILGGFSLGGTLALLLAAERQGEVDGVFTINPAIRLRHPLAPFVSTLMHVHSVKRRIVRNGSGLDRLNRSESPDLNYHVDYLWGVRELRRAMAACRHHLEHVSAPCLTIQTENDPAVHARGAKLIHKRIASEEMRLETLPGRRHVIVRGAGADELFNRIGRFVDEVLNPRARQEIKSGIGAVDLHSNRADDLPTGLAATT